MRIFKLAIFAISAIAITSCSNKSDDEVITDPIVQPRFNLNPGSLWVYKTYERNDYTSEFKYANKIDSVKVESIVDAGGYKYAKVKETTWNLTQNSHSSYVTYQRINSKGYLVALSSYLFDQAKYGDAFENVKHPNTDANFQVEVPFPPNSKVVYKLEPKENVVVDGKSYEVNPYNGRYYKDGSTTADPNKIVKNNYAFGIGLVNTYCHSESGTYNFEDRLVSYTLK
ncbi:hypothetical protein [Soonwooa sp.]|uniref:hypothetical protein n=1 Tax=Soonwooa sp. TaxID=1938592 RepID=UPI0026383F9B|nr:hypothetical protein [Soonwooa sp.]